MQYEVEIKSLLGSQAKLDETLAAMQKLDPKLEEYDRQKQLNHYFHDGELKKLGEELQEFLKKEELSTLADIAAKATHTSVRTRDKNGTVIVVIKGSLDENDADHSVRRMELEVKIPLQIEKLDKRVLASGYKVLAKWSAERTFYHFLGFTAELMFSPGYGHMLELEKVVTDERQIPAAQDEIKALMQKLGVEPVDQQLIGKMYDFYNNHWQDYYATTNVFTPQIFAQFK